MRNPLVPTLGGALLALALAAPAGAGTLYRWTAPDGSVAFTDDAKRIPERYRDDAERVPTRGLDGYGRYTPTRPEPGDGYRARLEARLERLRAINRPERVALEAEPGRSTVVRLDDRNALELPLDPARDEGPVVVEEHRVRDPNGITTRHVTVVRQGDSVLSVIRPRSSLTSATPPTEAELLD